MSDVGEGLIRSGCLAAYFAQDLRGRLVILLEKVSCISARWLQYPRVNLPDLDGSVYIHIEHGS